MDDEIDHLLPSPQEDYEQACEATLARRLMMLLHARGVISHFDYTNLLYPSQDEIDAANEL